MKNLLTYESYIAETTPSYSFDGCELKVGSPIIADDGFSGVIISKEINNGTISFRDNKGIIHVCESSKVILDESLNEDLQWWEVTKGILAADAIKVGIAFAGGGLVLAGALFSHWRNSIANKIEKYRSDAKYKEMRVKAESIADKFNNDKDLDNMLKDLQKYPYKDTTFLKGIRAPKNAKENNAIRNKLMRDIAKHVKSKLTPDETEFFVEINKVLRDKPLIDEVGQKVEEDLSQLAAGVQDPNSNNSNSQLNNDPNRTVGIGTYNATHSDGNFNTKGYNNPTDSASNGSYPTYIG